MSDKPWGGVFDQAMDHRVEKFTESVSFDRRLYAHDIRGSIAHANIGVQAKTIRGRLEPTTASREPFTLPFLPF